MSLTSPGSRRGRMLSAIGAATVLLTVAACDVGSTAEQHFERAWSSYVDGDLRTAVIELKNALEKEPDFADARELLGRTYLFMDQADAAEKELRRAQELGYGGDDFEQTLIQAALVRGRFAEVESKLEQPSFQLAPEAQLALRGTARFGLGKYEAAEADFRGALEISPKMAGARRGLAHIAMNREQLDEAARQLDLAFEINDTDPQTLMDRGYLETRRGNYDAAAAAYQKVLGAYPNSMRARVPLIRVELLRGNVDKAKADIAELSKAMRGNLSEEVLHLRAYAALLGGDARQAEDDLAAALALNPNYVPSLYLYGDVLFKKGEVLKATEYLRRYNANSPRMTIGRVLLAAAELQLDEPEKAVATAQEALAIDPDDVAALGVLGGAYMRQGKLDAAVQTLTRAAELAPEVGSVRTDLGAALISSGDVDAGLLQLQQAADTANFEPARHLWILVQLRRGKFDEAVQAATELTAARPDDGTAWSLLGSAQQGKGEMELARDSYERALAIDASFSAPQVNLARIAEESGDFAQARERYESVLAREDVRPGLRAEVAVELAGIDLKEGKPEEALRHFEAALQHDPANTEALVGLATRRESTGTDTSAVVAKLEAARAADPTQLGPRLMLASFYLRAALPDRALAAAQEAVDIAPRAEAALLVLAASQAATGAVDEAIETCRRTTALFPQSARAFIELARWATFKGDIDVAREALSRALEIDPKDVESRVGLATLTNRAGRFEEALEVARSVQREHPTDVRGFNLEANLWLSNGDEHKVVAVLEDAFEVAPTRAQAVSLFYGRWRIGETDAAVEGLQSWLAAHPSDHTIHALAGNVAQQQGRYADAANHYRIVLAAFPRDVFALNNLAWVEHMAGNNAEALKFAEQAVEVAPGLAPALDTHGWLLTLAGRTEQGLASLSRANQTAPDDPLILYHLAYALTKVGQRDAALAAVQKALAGTLAAEDRQGAEQLLRKLQPAQ